MQILNAWSKNQEDIVQTDLEKMSSVPGSNSKILLKREDRQHGFSFHLRGATNLLSVCLPSHDILTLSMPRLLVRASPESKYSGIY